MLHRLRRAYRRLRFGKPIVVVSGLPRSGTSMTMKMLRAGGLEIVADGVRTADEDNPQGYFEDERVKELQAAEDRSWLREARGKAIKVISYLLKDLPAENNYRVIFMHRDLEEVLASQKKMLDRREERSETDDQRMRELFESHLWRVGYLFEHAPHFEVMELRYSDVLGDPVIGAERIDRFLGGGLAVDRMAGAVDERLYRNRLEGLGDGPRHRSG